MEGRDHTRDTQLIACQCHTAFLPMGMHHIGADGQEQRLHICRGVHLVEGCSLILLVVQLFRERFVEGDDAEAILVGLTQQLIYQVLDIDLSSPVR